MPPRVVTNSSFDVLWHALEWYTALPYQDRVARPSDPKDRPAFQGSNPISDVWSHHTLCIVAKYMKRSGSKNNGFVAGTTVCRSYTQRQPWDQRPKGLPPGYQMGMVMQPVVPQRNTAEIPKAGIQPVIRATNINMKPQQQPMIKPRQNTKNPPCSKKTKGWRSSGHGAASK